MPAPSTTDDFLALVAKSDLLPASRLEEFLARRRAEKTLPSDLIKLAQVMVLDGLLTKYQAEQLLGGRWRNFIIGGKYKLLERLGKGGMALVFLCEHQVMKRLVALKILPTAHAEDKELLGRFHREARALSQLRHPNIVGAYDVDHASKVHFLVMEYVDGGDLDQIVQRAGPLSWERAANYIRQAAHGLQHAHECGLVHRDIKPGNLLVDRSGTVKLLDLGLARIFHETTDDLTTGRDAKTLLGTVDYLAPEQALNSHDVNIRADIYGLGATFYYILTGKGLFEEGTVAQKLSWHLHRPPVPISDARPDVPVGLIQVIERMLAKRPEDRYQTPEEVVDALEPWTRTQIAPPSLEELPQLSRAARGIGQPSSVRLPAPSSKSLLTNAPKVPASDTPSKATKILPADPARGSRPAPPVSKVDPPVSKVVPPAEPTPIVAPEPAPSPVKPSVASPVPRWKKGRNVAAMVAGLLAVLAGGWWAFLGPNGTEVSPSPRILASPTVSPSASPEPFSHATSPNPVVADSRPVADRAGDVSIALLSGSEPARTFPSLREAVRSAKSGDRLVVRGSLLSEALDLSEGDGVPKDLTIEGINPKGKGQPVRWQASKDLSPGRALLDVSGLEGFKLKGFLFDGQGRVAELIRLSGRGAGGILEDLQIEGATRAGIVLRGWAGESSRPSTIRKVWFSTADESEAAIVFDADLDRPTVGSSNIEVTSCRFVGPYQSALLVAGPVEGLDIEQCRFFKNVDGLRYKRTEARSPIRLRLANNTFAELQRGLHFETTPPSASSDLVVANNLFSMTPRLAMLDKVSVQPAKPAGSWIWTEEGKKKPTVPAGSRQFRGSFDVAAVPSKARLDISCDETFTVWLNGAEVYKNPSPHFTQRVFSIDVAGQLRKGRNVLAVQGTNRLDRLDSKFGTTAGLLAQIITTDPNGETVLVKTDETWKCSDQGPEGWTRPEFDDQSWTSARPWPNDGNIWPWAFVVWDSTVLPQLKPPLEPIRITASGNVRDYKSWEGYPTIDAERVAAHGDGPFEEPGRRRDVPPLREHPARWPRQARAARPSASSRRTEWAGMSNRSSMTHE